MSLNPEKKKLKRLNLRIKDRNELFSWVVDGFKISEFIELENHYEFKGEYISYDGLPDFYLFKLEKISEPDSDKASFKLRMYERSDWGTPVLLSLSEIKIRRLFFKKCIEMIEFYEYNKI